MGNNGYGKTTLVRTLTGLIKPVSGTIELDGKPAKPRDLTRAGFLVMQDVNYQLFSDSVREELLIGLDETDDGITTQANQVMADLDLTAFAERHPMSLSGGQKQRVAIGSALMCGKALIILGKPTSGLDRYHMEQVGELLRQLAAQGKAILVVTHDEELAAGWCDRIVDLGADDSAGNGSRVNGAGANNPDSSNPDPVSSPIPPPCVPMREPPRTAAPSSAHCTTCSRTINAWRFTACEVPSLSSHANAGIRHQNRNNARSHAARFYESAGGARPVLNTHAHAAL